MFNFSLKVKCILLSLFLLHWKYHWNGIKEEFIWSEDMNRYMKLLMPARARACALSEASPNILCYTITLWNIKRLTECPSAHSVEMKTEDLPIKTPFAIFLLSNWTFFCPLCWENHDFEVQKNGRLITSPKNKVGRLHHCKLWDRTFKKFTNTCFCSYHNGR